jgi:EAL domain-containing protein (putative c-di-GMP-specific phosphodiesterase class I)
LLLCWGLYAACTQSRFKIRWDTLEPAQAEEQTFNVQQALRLALEEADIRIKFEPRPELHGGGVFGMQVWVCWPQPDGRVLQRSPADFVEEASQDGLFLPLADWVLETACQQAAQWQRAYGPLALALNISKHQLQDPNFSTRVRAICDATQFPYQSLVCLRSTSVWCSKISRNRWQISKH